MPSPPVEAPPQGRFVVFREPALVIDRLGIPVAVPVSAESAPSPETMVSEAPEVVTVDASGALVAHRNGTTRVRAIGGGALAVEVRAVTALALVPPAVTLGPGEEIDLRLDAGDAEHSVPGEAATWYTTAPQTATVRNGRVRAGETAGTAVVTASYGGHLARAQVTIGERRSPIAVRPERAALRRGEVVAFEAVSPQGSVPARWESRAPRVVAQVQGNVFQARARGKAAICAAVGKRVACGAVEVGD